MSNARKAARMKIVEEWAGKLTADEMRPLLIELVDFSIDAEMVQVDKLPYWSNTGDPLIAGQQPFEDD